MGNIDDGPIRISQQKGVNIDLLVEIENEAGLIQIAREPYFGGDRKITGDLRADGFVPGGKRSRAGSKYRYDA